ncbi:hypothetical protein J3Q00_10270 [Pseudomonas sp. D2-3]
MTDVKSAQTSDFLSKPLLERVLAHWGAIAWLLSLLGLIVGGASLFCYTHAIGRTDLFQAAAGDQALLLVWLVFVGLMSIAFILIMATSAVLFGLAVSMLNRRPCLQRQAVSTLFFIVSAGYACFGSLILWAPEWGVKVIFLLVCLVTALATVVFYLFNRKLRVPVNYCAKRPKKGKAASPWTLLFFLFLALLGTVVSGVFPTQMVLMAYRGEDTPEGVGRLMLIAVFSMIIALVPVWAFYKTRGALVRRWRLCLAGFIGALLFYIVLSPATLGIVTYAAANVMGVRDSHVQDYLLTDKDVIGELDTNVWSLQPKQQGAARIKAFKLFGFGSMLLLCPAELAKIELKKWPEHSGRCLLTSTGQARLLPH